jgi:hypothetical protein
MRNALKNGAWLALALTALVLGACQNGAGAVDDQRL